MSGRLDEEVEVADEASVVAITNRSDVARGELSYNGRIVCAEQVEPRC